MCASLPVINEIGSWPLPIYCSALEYVDLHLHLPMCLRVMCRDNCLVVAFFTVPVWRTNFNGFDDSLKDNHSRAECWQRCNLVTMYVPGATRTHSNSFFVIRLMMPRFLWYLLRWIVNEGGWKNILAYLKEISFIFSVRDRRLPGAAKVSYKWHKTCTSSVGEEQRLRGLRGKVLARETK